MTKTIYYLLKKIAFKIFSWFDSILLRIPFYARRSIVKLIKKTPHNDLESHCYITGKTGSGKSSYLLNLIYGRWYTSRKNEDISIVVLDPHGDMVDTIKRFDLGTKYFNRMQYISPFLRKDYIPCINPLELYDTSKESVDLTTQQLVRVFGELIPDARLTNYMKAVLKPCIYTLLNLNSCTLQDLQDFMSKTKNERWINEGKRSSVKSHKRFFQNEFENRLYDGTKGSIYTKLLSLLNSEVFYNITSSGISTINLEESVNRGKIILFNLSKGKLGEEVSETFGRLIIAQLQSIAIRRAKLSPKMRKKIYLVIDEADTFISGNSLNVILKETRKYGLHLILCTQNLIAGRDQEALKRNIINNTNVKIVGANGQSTLFPLSKEIGIPSDTLSKTRKHEFWIKSGDKKTIKIRTKDTLGDHSPLLVSPRKIASINNRIIKEGGYYKLIPSSNTDTERVNDLPLDRQKRELDEASPLARFTL